MQEDFLREVISKFDVQGEFTFGEKYGLGHINDTYLVKTLSSEKKLKFIVQRINQNVFPNVEELMENISKVTEFLRNKVSENGGNPDREALSLVKTKDGKNFYKDEKGDCYRCYIFIDKATAFQNIVDPNDFYQSAKAFGKFQRLLNGFDAGSLYEVIPNFHNTAKRFEDFKIQVNKAIAERKKSCLSEIEFVLQREKYVAVVQNKIESGELPLRVTHNDTKLNNVMIDDETKLGIAVIDLDTVMSGSLLYDFGDSIRFGANNCEEDEENLENVSFDISLFELYVEGFLEEVKEIITESELRCLAFSALLMTFECGMRFLGDYLVGDVYFKVKKPNHNLIRAKVQFKLVREMEEKLEDMQKIVFEKFNKIKEKAVND